MSFILSSFSDFQKNISEIYFFFTAYKEEQTLFIIKTIMKTQLYFFFLISILISPAIYAYSIEGTWKLTHIRDQTLISQHPLDIHINSLIFNQLFVTYKIELRGCQKFEYFMEIHENNIFLDYHTFFKNPYLNEKCLYEDLAQEKLAAKLLKNVFFFQIINQNMLFSDAEGNIIFKFERRVANSQKSLPGNWILPFFKGQTLSETFQINQRQIIFCSQKVKVPYNIIERNQIQFGTVQNEGCEKEQILNALLSAKLVIIRNDRLEMFGDNDEFVFYMIRKKINSQSSQQSTKNQTQKNSEETQKLIKQEQIAKLEAQKQKAIQIALEKQKEFSAKAERARQQILRQQREDEMKKLREQREIAIQTALQKQKQQEAETERVRQQILKEKREEEMKRLKQQREAAIQSALQKQITQSSPIVQQQIKKSQVFPQINNNITDLLGRWKIDKIFSLNNFLPHYELIFSESSIQLVGGCNNHSLLYTTSPQNKSKILLGKINSTTNKCSSNDDGLFITGMQKIDSYLINIVENQVEAIIVDIQNEEIFKLKKKVSTNSK